MVDAAKFVESARSFVDEQSHVFGLQYLKVKDECEANDYTRVINRLMGALELTTESIFTLTENEQVWDLPILFRSVLEGSARAMYLISAPSREEGFRRADEYANLLLKAEMASLEQPIHLWMKNEEERTETSKNVEYTVRVLKTGAGEGDAMRKLASKWNFWNVSRALRKECRQWATSSDTWELQYAAANGVIHKTHLCTQYTLANYHATFHGNLSPLREAALPIEGCVVLQFDRLFLYSMRLEFDPAPLVAVKSRHEDFFDMLKAIRAEAEKDIETHPEAST